MKNRNKSVIVSLITLVFTLSYFSMSAQSGLPSCQCNETTSPSNVKSITLAFANDPSGISYTIKYFDCGGRIRIYDILVNGGYALPTAGMGPVWFANAMTLFLQNNPSSATILEFEAECYTWTSNNNGWTAGSGENGAPTGTTHTLTPCGSSGCCQMDISNFNMGQFFSVPEHCDAAMTCFKVCHP